MGASACHNYSPRPADDCAIPFYRRNQGFEGGFRPGGAVPPTGDPPEDRALDVAGARGANFAGMATMTVSTPTAGGPPELSGPVPLEIADSARARHRGLLGRTGLPGALLLTPASSVHTVRMRFAIDVAYLDRALRVLSVRTMRPGRIGLPRPRARHVLEAEAGAMAGWGVRPGALIVVHGGAQGAG